MHESFFVQHHEDYMEITHKRKVAEILSLFIIIFSFLFGLLYLPLCLEWLGVCLFHVSFGNMK